MDDSYKLVSLKISLARQRCEALGEELQSLRTKDYASPGSNRLLNLVAAAIDAIEKFLQTEEQIAGTGLLGGAELETRVHRAAQLIPYLHQILGYIEGSDTSCTPTPLIAQLGRFANQVLPSSEVIVSAVTELNYSIQELAGNIRELFQGTLLESSCESLPPYLFVITIPKVESNYVLLHCILSHELGHGLYNVHKSESKILPKIQIDQELVKQTIHEEIRNEKGEMPPPLLEVAIREDVTRQLINMVTMWVQELCADAFGMMLFGPAYYFAFIHFMLGFLPLDRVSDSHPAPRLRLHLMSRILAARYGEAGFDDSIKEFISFWTQISSQKVQYRHKLMQIAGDAVSSAEVLDSISQETVLCLGDPNAYTAQQYNEDIKNFGDLLVGLIPPGEYGGLGNERATSITTIMNTGWYIYLSRLKSFSENLSENERSSSRRVQMKLQDLLLKAFEISEIRQSWREISDDIGVRGD